MITFLSYVFKEAKMSASSADMYAAVRL